MSVCWLAELLDKYYSGSYVTSLDVRTVSLLTALFISLWMGRA